MTIHELKDRVDGIYDSAQDYWVSNYSKGIQFQPADSQTRLEALQHIERLKEQIWETEKYLATIENFQDLKQDLPWNA